MKCQKPIDTVLVQLLFILVSAASLANDIGAVSDGFWNSSLTWTPMSIPSAVDDVYIGSSSPSGSATIAIVTLLQDQTARNVFLGNGAGTAGTLDLGNYHLDILETLYLGYSGSASGNIQRGSGYISAAGLWIDHGNTFNFGILDTVSGLDLNNSAMATTVAAGNVTGYVSIYSGSKLTLATNMTLSGYLNMQQTGSILDMGGHSLTANQVYLGTDWNGGSPTLLNRASFVVNYLSVANQVFNLTAADSVSSFALSNGSSTINSPLAGLTLYNNATATTTAAGNVTANATISSGSKLTLGANMSLSGGLNLRDSGSTLDMAGYSLNAKTFSFGWDGGTPALLNRAPLIVTSLYVANQAFDLTRSDTVSNFYLSSGTSTINTLISVSTLSLSNNATVTTTTVGNVSGNATITSGSKLTLGANMSLSGGLNLRDTGSIFDQAGRTLTANTFYFGWSGGSPTLLNRAPLNLSSFYVANCAFDLNATDTVSNFSLSNGTSTINPLITVSSLSLSSNATATTTSVGNVTGNATISSGSKLTLGASMLLSGDLNLRDSGSTLDMAGHSLNVKTFSFGWDGGTPALLNRAPLTATSLYVANQAFDLAVSDTVPNFALSSGTSTLNPLITVSSLSLSNNATATTTAEGNVTANATISSGSKLTLGANMSLSGGLNLRDSGSTLDMAGHSLNVKTFSFGWDGGTPALLNRAPLTANSVYVTNQAFDLQATDWISSITLSGGSSRINTPLTGLTLYNNATATTTAAGSVAGNATISSGSKLTLGANMSLSGGLNLRDSGSTLDMAGHSLNAKTFSFGWNGGTPTLLNPGTLIAQNLYVGHGSALTLSSAGTISQLINLSNASTLTMLQPNGQLTGLTLNGTNQGSLSLYDSSTMKLNFGQARFSHWIFRWRDRDSSVNWQEALTGLISAGRISITPSNGYYIADSGGYTYIYTAAQAADFDWCGGNASGPVSWNLATNWNPSTTVPNAPGVTISFGNQSASNDTVALDSKKTVGNLIFVGGTNTILQGTDGSSLTLDNNGSLSTIDVTGFPIIAVPVGMKNDVQIAGIGTVTLAAGISGPYTLKVLGSLTTSSIEVNTLFLGDGTTAAAAVDRSASSVAPVPEPGTIILLVMFAGGLWCSKHCFKDVACIG